MYNKLYSSVKLTPEQIRHLSILPTVVDIHEIEWVSLEEAECVLLQEEESIATLLPTVRWYNETDFRRWELDVYWVDYADDEDMNTAGDDVLTHIMEIAKSKGYTDCVCRASSRSFVDREYREIDYIFSEKSFCKKDFFYLSFNHSVAVEFEFWANRNENTVMYCKVSKDFTKHDRSC